MDVKEKVDALIEYILQKTNNEKEKIMNDAKEKASKISEDYRNKAKKRYEAIISQAKEESQIQYNKKVRRAIHEAEREIIRVNNELLNEFLDKTKDKIKSIPSSSEYPELLKKMVNEAIETLNRKKVLLKFNESDKEILEKIEKEVKSKHKNIELDVSEETLNIVFGVYACSHDEHIVVKNTANERINEHKSEIAATLYEMLNEEIG